MEKLVRSVLSHPLTFYCKVLYDAVVNTSARWLLACYCVAAATIVACGQSNNLLFGHVQATVGTHTVVVSDCYRISVPPPQKSADGYRFIPCRDADLTIHDELLSVNGRSYGRLNPGDGVLVDHGVVSVNHHQPGNDP